jgi:hypothetical protein
MYKWMNLVDTLVLTGMTETICLYSRTPLIQSLVMQITVTQIGLALQVNLSIILQNYLALKLPVIGSSTVQWYGF